MIKRLVAFAFSLFLLTSVYCLAAEGAPVKLRFIMQAPGSSFYIYGMSIARMFEQYLPKGSEAEIIGRGGANINPTILNDRRGDIS
ncbi:MAG: hypothetical protein FWG74_09115, partial [Planctomycetes bacterium]|nr:hypothetical protein [Planctomycetota bacterium]